MAWLMKVLLLAVVTCLLIHNTDAGCNGKAMKDVKALCENTVATTPGAYYEACRSIADESMLKRLHRKCKKIICSSPDSLPVTEDTMCEFYSYMFRQCAAWLTASPSNMSTCFARDPDSFFLTTNTKECHDGWTKHGTSCYILGSQYKNWDQAKESCVSGDYGEESYLLEINTLEEYEYINKTLLLQYGYPHTQLWLGARWEADRWVWQHSGEVIPSTWSQWGYRGPLSTSVGVCLCISTSQLFTGQLFDYRCSEPRPYICEYDI